MIYLIFRGMQGVLTVDRVGVDSPLFYGSGSLWKQSTCWLETIGYFLCVP